MTRLDNMVDCGSVTNTQLVLTGVQNRSITQHLFAFPAKSAHSVLRGLWKSEHRRNFVPSRCEGCLLCSGHLVLSLCGADVAGVVLMWCWCGAGVVLMVCAVDIPDGKIYIISHNGQIQVV